VASSQYAAFVIDVQPVTDEPEQQPAKSKAAFWKELAILVTVAIVVSVVVRTFLIQTFYIPSGSMEHTLNINDRVLVNKIVYDFRNPSRGEIIVFLAPPSWRQMSSDQDFIKRVIGVGGDHVVCCDALGRITVNGAPLNEPYVYRGADGQQDPPSPNPFDIVVPPGRLWVMGDHRAASADSRERYKNSGDIIDSTIDVHVVVGRAFVLFWPPSRFAWLTVPDTFDHIPAPTGR
jgi:signal peptidase I